MKKVLVAEDEESIREFIVINLTRSGYTVEQAENGAVALEKFAKDESGFDVAILDIMMPGMDGFAVLRRIREKSRIPALMMTARTEDYDKILGLELGADDYITKPYNPLEVVARVKAQLRRCYAYQEQKSEETEVLKALDLVMHLAEGTLFRNGEAITLTATEFKILGLFMRTPGQIYTKQQIFSYAWDDAYLGDDSTVMVHISNLRNKIEEDPKNPKRIKTVKGLGYKLEKESL